MFRPQFEILYYLFLVMDMGSRASYNFVAVMSHVDDNHLNKSDFDAQNWPWRTRVY